MQLPPLAPVIAQLGIKGAGELARDISPRRGIRKEAEELRHTASSEASRPVREQDPHRYEDLAPAAHAAAVEVAEPELGESLQEQYGGDDDSLMQARRYNFRQQASEQELDDHARIRDPQPQGHARSQHASGRSAAAAGPDLVQGDEKTLSDSAAGTNSVEEVAGAGFGSHAGTAE